MFQVTINRTLWICGGKATKPEDGKKKDFKIFALLFSRNGSSEPTGARNSPLCPARPGCVQGGDTEGPRDLLLAQEENGTIWPLSQAS